LSTEPKLDPGEQKVNPKRAKFLSQVAEAEAEMESAKIRAKKAEENADLWKLIAFALLAVPLAALAAPKYLLSKSPEKTLLLMVWHSSKEGDDAILAALRGTPQEAMIEEAITYKFKIKKWMKSGTQFSDLSSLKSKTWIKRFSDSVPEVKEWMDKSQK
jgi:hypothetical protein